MSRKVSSPSSSSAASSLSKLTDTDSIQYKRSSKCSSSSSRGSSSVSLKKYFKNRNLYHSTSSPPKTKAAVFAQNTNRIKRSDYMSNSSGHLQTNNAKGKNDLYHLENRKPTPYLAFVKDISDCKMSSPISMTSGRSLKNEYRYNSRPSTHSPNSPPSFQFAYGTNLNNLVNFFAQIIFPKNQQLKFIKT